MSDSCQLIIYEPEKEPRIKTFDVNKVIIDNVKPSILNEDGTILEQYRIISGNFSDAESEHPVEIIKNNEISTSVQNYLNSCPTDSSKKLKKIERIKKSRLAAKNKKLKYKNRKKKKDLFNLMNEGMNYFHDLPNNSQFVPKIKWKKKNINSPNMSTSLVQDHVEDKLNNNANIFPRICLQESAVCLFEPKKEQFNALPKNPHEKKTTRTIKRRLARKKRRENQKINKTMALVELAETKINENPISAPTEAVNTFFLNYSNPNIFSGRTSTKEYCDRSTGSFINFYNSIRHEHSKQENPILSNFNDPETSLKTNSNDEQIEPSNVSLLSNFNQTSFESLDYIPFNQEKLKPISSKHKSMFVNQKRKPRTSMRKNNMPFASSLRYFNCPIG